MKNSKVIALILAMSMLFSMFTTVFAYDMTTQNDMLLISPNPFADDSIKVLVNDQQIDFTDENGNVVEPKIINSRTMVPMRKIFEVFGANVEWEGTTQTITATTENKTLVLQINNQEATVKSGDTEEKIMLDSAPVIYDSRTLVPVRFIAESLELHVGWVPETRTVVILDSSFIYDRLQKETPNLYEFMSYKGITPETLQTAFKANATLNYKDSDKNITNLKSVLNGVIKYGSNKMFVDMTLKTTGKGTLLDTLKENGFDDISLSEIADFSEKVIYIKSSLLESEIGKKWARINSVEAFDKYNTILSSKDSFKDTIETALNEMKLTENSYSEINNMLDYICAFANDKYFKVSGRTTKTYTYEIDLDDIIEILDLNITRAELKEETQISDASIKISTKVRDGYATDTSLAMSLKIEDEAEQVEIKLDLSQSVEKMNEEITINIPNERNVVNISEM